jgi:type IV pilus assembly protein PilW
MAVTDKHRQSGFSLVELMIGMLLGVMLLAGAASIYLASKRSFTEVEQIAALSDNARFALQILTDSLRHVGFTGQGYNNSIDIDPAIASVTSNCTNTAASNAEAYNLARPLEGVLVNGTYGDEVDRSLFTCITDAKSATDVLIIKHVVSAPLWDADPDDPNAVRNGEIDFPGTLDPSTTYVMTNNVVARLFDGNDMAPTITLGGDIPNGTAWPYLFEIFYVRNTATGPHLARKYLQWNSTLNANEVKTENLAAGVERMHFMFGRDTDADGEIDIYSNISEVNAPPGAWAEVASIEAYLLVRNATPDPQYIDEKFYVLADKDPFQPKATPFTGSTIAPNNFRRMVMHTSVSMRNMKLMLRGGGT